MCPVIDVQSILSHAVLPPNLTLICWRAVEDAKEDGDKDDEVDDNDDGDKDKGDDKDARTRMRTMNNDINSVIFLHKPPLVRNTRYIYEFRNPIIDL